MAGYMKGLNGDAYRVSLSSSVSSSNQGSGHYDGDALACSGQHAALVTKKGYVFSWGVKSDGRLRDGVDSNVSHPKLIDSLKNINVELVACGEYHSCVVSLSGEMYSWGGSSGNFGLLGHGSETSQWIPKNLNGPLEGIHVSSGSCGPWHTGGDKGRVGHGGEEARLVHTCVAALAMGSPVYMHLWNPQADGKLSIRVEGKLAKNSVEEIAYGAYRVALLTSKTETYPWGKGENGQLGHGDTDDKNSPFLVESLGDKTGQECCLWCMFYCSYLSS
ncbi:hypothetical protein GQ457_14G018870 [Hibiscus cannabinus]